MGTVVDVGTSTTVVSMVWEHGQRTSQATVPQGYRRTTERNYHCSTRKAPQFISLLVLGACRRERFSPKISPLEGRFRPKSERWSPLF
jgi:hypothetical protein